MAEYEFARIGYVSPTVTLNFRGPEPQVTVPILGFPRGGTTMVAAVIEALGVYLGPRAELRGFHHEDQTMNSADLARLYPCITARNAEHDKWGWKNPTGMPVFREISFALRNPRLVIVFRDALATAMGEMRFDEQFNHDRRSLGQLLDFTQKRQQEFVDFCSRTQSPTLLVSYELAMRDPAQFIADVISFLGLTETTQEMVNEAMSRIAPRGGYITKESLL